VKSPDPLAPPAIRPNYLTDPLDCETIVAGMKFARVIAAQPALEPFMEAEIMPGPEVTDDAAILAHVRAHGSTIYHPVGTCRMGPASDPLAVTDPAGRVHGIGGLRVVDASLMPRLVSGNTNAPTIMMAEKLSDAILADARAARAA
jgi:choline dehydrogenase